MLKLGFSSQSSEAADEVDEDRGEFEDDFDMGVEEVEEDEEDVDEAGVELSAFTASAFLACDAPGAVSLDELEASRLCANRE